MMKFLFWGRICPCSDWMCAEFDSQTRHIIIAQDNYTKHQHVLIKSENTASLYICFACLALVWTFGNFFWTHNLSPAQLPTWWASCPPLEGSELASAPTTTTRTTASTGTRNMTHLALKMRSMMITRWAAVSKTLMIIIDIASTLKVTMVGATTARTARVWRKTGSEGGGNHDGSGGGRFGGTTLLARELFFIWFLINSDI